MEKTTRTRFISAFHYLTGIVERLIGLIMVIGILYLMILLVLDYGGYAIRGENFAFNELLAQSLNLVIGIEFTRMLCHHSPNIMVDVLMFATARQAVLDHSDVLQNLIAVIAITILFAVKRFILTDRDTQTEVSQTVLNQEKT